MTGLHKQIRGKGMAVFVDLRALAHSLRARVPVAVARRKAEYVLIDHARVPLGFDDADFLARHLWRIQHVRHGMGFSGTGTARLERHLLPPHPPSLEVRIALRREDHAEPS